METIPAGDIDVVLQEAFSVNGSEVFNVAIPQFRCHPLTFDSRTA